MTRLLSAYLTGFRLGPAAKPNTRPKCRFSAAVIFKRFLLFRCAAAHLGLLAALIGPGGISAAGVPEAFNARGVQLDLYARDSVQVIARCELDRVFLEHRKLGFFRVKLLPMLVAEGVRVEFTQANPQTNWVEGFRFNPAPTVHARAMEWRKFRLFFPGEKTPRLCADRVIPAAMGAPAVCRLEGIELATGGEPLRLARGELNETADGGMISWRSETASFRWDLLTGQCTTNSNQQSKLP